MLPEPVETESSTRPLTERLRSKVASEASAGIAARARAAVAIQRFFIFSSFHLKGSGDQESVSADSSCIPVAKVEHPVNSTISTIAACGALLSGSVGVRF